MTYLTEIPDCERDAFGKFIKAQRKRFIPSPKETVKQVLATNHLLMKESNEAKEVSKVIAF